MMDGITIEQLQNLERDKIVAVAEFKGNHIRIDALKEIALGLGIRGGLSDRAKKINQEIKKYDSSLYKIYDFRRLIISKPAGEWGTNQYVVIPPVITEAEKTLKAISDDEIHTSDRMYRIDQQAKFVTATPTWMDYLIQPGTAVELPHGSLLPKTDEERKVWKEAIAQGWTIGEKQSDAIFDNGLNKLNRDYLGMIRYKMLYNQKIVSEPYLSENRLGVTGGGKSLSVDSRVLKITIHPSLNKDSSKWDPVVWAE